jgi:hypothetical protein
MQRSTVVVTTRHAGASDAVDYKLTRATIELIPVSSTMCPAAGGTPCRYARASNCAHFLDVECPAVPYEPGVVGSTSGGDDEGGVCAGEGTSKVGMIRLSTFNSFSAGAQRHTPHRHWPSNRRRCILAAPRIADLVEGGGRGRASGAG